MVLTLLKSFTYTVLTTTCCFCSDVKSIRPVLVIFDRNVAIEIYNW